MVGLIKQCRTLLRTWICESRHFLLSCIFANFAEFNIVFFITSLTCSEFYLVTLQWRASSKNIGTGTKETDSGDLILGWINRRQTLFVLASCNMNTTACTTVSKCVRNVFWQKFVLSVDGIFLILKQKQNDIGLCCLQCGISTEQTLSQK